MNLKILIVDDDENFLAVLESVLLEEKHHVTTAHNGLEAIENCRKRKFDLVISDLMMPGAGGMEVLAECRKLYPDILVILITGFASLETAVEAIRQGAYDYITKPFKLEELKIVVNNASERILLIRENQRLFRELQEAEKQLHIVKKIMGAQVEDHRDPDASSTETRKNEPLIAGSMLPHYYFEKKADMEHPFLLDLERISTLRDKGFLSEEEFDLCKSKLFQNLNH
ncbi:sigma-54-dependent transcriptional regulator [Thermodesulfobacteriota bacterium]